MEPMIRNLERLRRRTRMLLLVLHASTWMAVALLIILSAALADFGLRFPGWMRLILLVAGFVAGGYYLLSRMARAVRAYPSLPSLALRLERLYPQAAGRLASAVAFSMQGPGDADSPVTAGLTQRSVDSAQGVLDDEQVRKLVDPAPAIRSLAVMVLILGAIAGVALGAPESFRIAFERWTRPLGDARWPNRYGVEGLIEADVAPNNVPIPFAARIVKGDHEKLRTWVVYRFIRDGASPGEWQRSLMTRQDEGGRYERPIEPQATANAVEFYFEAGDDETIPQTLTLIQPPTLTAFTAETLPPPYAADVLLPDRQDLLHPPRPTVNVEALEGSRIELTATVEGSFTALGPEPDAVGIRDWITHSMPGLLDDLDAVGFAAMAPSYRVISPTTPPGDGKRKDLITFEVAFTLLRPAHIRLSLSDAYGTRYPDPRIFAFEVRPDRPPRAAVTVPAGDESVLATALVPAAGEGFDDVAVGELSLHARIEGRDPIALGSDSPNQTRARVESVIDLVPLNLKPGDEVALIATARDTFRLDDRTHEPVDSPPRVLRIIAEQDLSRQIHAELADLRQRALRAEATQRQLLEAPPNTSTVRQQQDLTQRVGQMRQTVDQLSERAQRNRLDDPALDEMLEASRRLTESAQKESERAAGQLASAGANPPDAQQATEQARAAQQETARNLDALSKLLDQGREAYALRQRLVKLAKEQEALSDETRQTLPRTLGRDPEQLTPEQRQQLADAAQKQKELSREAQDLTEQMRSTSSALNRRSQDPDQQAMAEALRQAAQTATEQSLQEQMQRASEQVERNQLADARQNQDRAQQTLNEMLEHINRAERLKQEILRRKLAELVEAIERLRDQQQAQIERLVAAVRFEDLDAPMLTLRRNTLSVSETARATSQEAGPVADRLDVAANHQGDAVRELRNAMVEAPAAEAAERASLAELEAALKLARELSSQAQQELTEEERRKLIEQYNAALEKQRAVRDETQGLAETPETDRNRRWRAQSLKAGKSQEEVAADLDSLREQINETIVYRSAHDQIDRWIKEATGDLSAAQPSRGTLFHQEMVITSIGSLIEALERDPPDEEQFAQDESGSSSGGGQQGGPQPLIPPVAELKLLKGRQVIVNNITRTLEQAPDADFRATILKEAARQQEDLAETGDKLLEQLQQQMQQPMPVPTD